MSWTYRVMRVQYDNGEYSFAIHEFYHEDGKIGWSERAINPYGQTLDELKKDYEMMAKAFEKPVLDFETGVEIKSE